MNDPRISRLAETLLLHSCRLEPGDKVLIEAFDLPGPDLVCALVELAADRGAVPLVSWKNNAVLRSLYGKATADSMQAAGAIEKHAMEQVQAYLGIRGSANSSEFADVPPDRMDLYQRHWWQPVHIDVRIRRTKWVVLRYPTPSMAQSAKMSTNGFEDFYFDVCTADYSAMEKAQQPLVDRMTAADKVRLVGPNGTDLSFSTAGIPVVPCSGQHNIPDGEVFTAPVKDSVEGVIRFNAASLYQGTVFEGIELHFEKGKI
ncbi:MAG: aminopeptidase, partial [Planctomycetia bacterium]